MKLLSPFDNALFIKNIRERFRAGALISSAVVVAIVVSFLLLSAYVTNEKGGTWISWYGAACFFLAIAQAMVILIGGTSAVASMAEQERQTGTLDFHRTSPTSRLNQALGFLFGGPAVEWCIVLVTTPLVVLFAVLAGVGLSFLAYLYISLALCALFFHGLVLAIMISINLKKIRANQSSAAVVLLLILTAGYLSFGYANNLVTLIHATCVPAYVLLAGKVMQAARDLPLQSHALYGIQWPPLLLQALIELPLLILALIVVMRKISHPERPPFSKVQSLAAIAFLFVLFIGDAAKYAEEGAAIFVYFAFTLGALGAASGTPTQPLYLKALRRMRKEDRTRLNFLAEQGSNAAWLLAFSILFALAYGTLVWMSNKIVVPLPGLLLPFAMTLCYLAWFAAGLETFRLSRYYAQRSLFAIVIGVLWIALPALGMLLFQAEGTFLFVFSPIFGMALGLEAFNNYGQLRGLDTLLSFVVANAFLACVALYLAWRARKRLQELA